MMVAVSLSFSMASAQAQAPAAKHSKSALADRFSVLLRGSLATEAEKANLRTGTTTLPQLVQSYSRHPKAEEALTAYWSQALAIDVPTAILDLQTKPTPGKSSRRLASDLGGTRVMAVANTSTGAYRIDSKNPARAAPGTVTPEIAVEPLNSQIWLNRQGVYVLVKRIGDVRPSYCPGRRAGIGCFLNPTDAAGTLRTECAAAANPADFYCSESAKVDWRPDWSGWPTEVVGGAEVPKALRVCEGVKLNCEAAGGASRCQPQRYTDNSFDVSVYTKPEVMRRTCEGARSFMRENVYCSDSDVVEVTAPWWKPDSTVRACRGLVKPEVCGPTLSKCVVVEPDVHRFGVQDPSFDHYRELVRGVSEEPGRMVAKIILESRSWNEVVLTSRGVLNSALEHHIGVWTPQVLSRASVFEENAPPNTYRDAAGALKFQPRPLSDKSFRWFDRGAGHAGILSTAAFVSSFNGTRAKANALYEGLLCRKFVIPAGIRPQPDNETDLTKKAVCRECHRDLEPMKEFFNRWQHPANNYAYVPSLAADGVFRGRSASDATGIAGILVEQPEFPVCAVQRMFEFFAGRTMTADEVRILRPRLVQKFESSGRKLWALVPDIIESPAFASK